jgi:hypothetical protein
MKPTIEQRIDEVNQKIQINLREKGRKRINFYLRSMITSEYPEMTLNAIGNAFNVDHSTIIYYRKTFEVNSKQPEYKLVVEALRLGIKPVFVQPVRIRKRNTTFDSKKHIAPLRVIQEISVSEAKKVLEKDRKHYLWGKEVHRWSEKDWENFYKLRSA